MRPKLWLFWSKDCNCQTVQARTSSFGLDLGLKHLNMNAFEWGMYPSVATVTTTPIITLLIHIPRPDS
jgi:hypothetical protein